MSNEATVQGGLTINKASVNLKYQSAPTQFRADITGSRGPTPGSIIVTYEGTNIDLSGLDSPGGLAFIKNKATSGFVSLGIHDGFEFYPFIDILPGEAYPIRLSRFIGQSFGTDTVGTGTYDNTTYRAWAKSIGIAESEIVVEAFDL